MLLNLDRNVWSLDFGQDTLIKILSVDFPWCGLLIDMTDLSVLADYTRYNG
ncbi:hypothetical protein BDN67DRAFT_1023647, partial [Paxillus ammoniavirescens]